MVSVGNSFKGNLAAVLGASRSIETSPVTGISWPTTTTMPWKETKKAKKRAGKIGKGSEKSSPRDLKPMKSALLWESSETPCDLLKGKLQSDLVETSVRAVTSKRKQDDLLLVYL